MSTLHAPPMTIPCEIVTPQRNEYGDYTLTSSTSALCWFEEIWTVAQKTGGETRDTDAILWLPADTPNVEEGTIITVEGHTTQVEKIIPARRLGGTVQFLKCYLTIKDLALIS